MRQRQTTSPIEKHSGDIQNTVAYLCDIQSHKLVPMLTPLLSITVIASEHRFAEALSPQ